MDTIRLHNIISIELEEPHDVFEDDFDNTSNAFRYCRNMTITCKYGEVINVTRLCLVAEKHTNQITIKKESI